VIKITLLSGFDHVVPTDLNGTPNYAAYSTSLNTQAALQAAYDAGHWEPYTPPEPEPLPPEPDWSAFRLALMRSPSFRAWSEQIPDTWREDLKLSAIAANLEALQGCYDVIKGDYPPTVEAVEEWADLAQQNAIAIIW
jgi:hypothetical protein